MLELLEKLSVIESDLDMSSEHINESTTVLTNIISSTQSMYQYSILHS